MSNKMFFVAATDKLRKRRGKKSPLCNLIFLYGVGNLVEGGNDGSLILPVWNYWPCISFATVHLQISNEQTSFSSLPHWNQYLLYPDLLLPAFFCFFPLFLLHATPHCWLLDCKLFGAVQLVSVLFAWLSKAPSSWTASCNVLGVLHKKCPIALGRKARDDGALGFFAFFPSWYQWALNKNITKIFI